MGQYYKPILRNEINGQIEQWLYSHNFDNGLKLMEHSYVGNPFVGAVCKLLYQNPKSVVWAGDYADDEVGTDINLYYLCENHASVRPSDIPNNPEGKYVINHTKKTYVSLVGKGTNEDVWDIHPLPILTCEGNGRGGGDYGGDEDFVGSWARDVISTDNVKPKGYKELKFNLVEVW